MYWCKFYYLLDMAHLSSLNPALSPSFVIILLNLTELLSLPSLHSLTSAVFSQLPRFISWTKFRTVPSPVGHGFENDYWRHDKISISFMSFTQVLFHSLLRYWNPNHHHLVNSASLSLETAAFLQQILKRKPLLLSKESIISVVIYFQLVGKWRII